MESQSELLIESQRASYVPQGVFGRAARRGIVLPGRDGLNRSRSLRKYLYGFVHLPSLRFDRAKQIAATIDNPYGKAQALKAIACPCA